MPLTFRWNGPIGSPVDGDDLRPETLAFSASIAARFAVSAGNRTVPLGDLFRVEGDGSDGHLIFEGDLRSVRGLASGMGSGRVEIRGDVGPRLATGMSGGSVRVEGSVGDRAGAELRGGTLWVRGNAGDWLGASLAGSRIGMRDGVIVVEGSAGNDVGLSLRRGLIVVRGRLGSGAGRGMIAGSILGFGPVGRAAGAGMKRGTLGFFGLEESGESVLLPSFEPSGTYRPQTLSITLKELEAIGFPVPKLAFSARVRRYNGDRVVGGRGEVLVVG